MLDSGVLLKCYFLLLFYLLTSVCHLRSNCLVCTPTCRCLVWLNWNVFRWMTSFCNSASPLCSITSVRFPAAVRGLTQTNRFVAVTNFQLSAKKTKRKNRPFYFWIVTFLTSLLRGQGGLGWPQFCWRTHCANESSFILSKCILLLWSFSYDEIRLFFSEDNPPLWESCTCVNSQRSYKTLSLTSSS